MSYNCILSRLVARLQGSSGSGCDNDYLNDLFMPVI